VERGDLLGALPWFGKALKEDQDPQHDEVHRLRLGSAIQQCPRLTQVWFHEDTVIDAQFSPDGRWVLTAGEDGVMRVWDAGTGGAISPPFQHIGNIRHARFSPDGEYIAAASEKVTGVWEARTGRAIFTSLGKGRPGFCINFSHDGHRIITAGVHSTTDVWDATTGDQDDLHFEPEGDVYWAAFSPDGSRMVTRSGERAVTLWDAHTGEQIAPPLSYRAAGHNPELGSDTLRRTCEFSPDSNRLAIPCGDGTARVCDARTGKELIKVSHRGEVRRACFR
jgi:WD40 repeat protein